VDVVSAWLDGELAAVRGELARIDGKCSTVAGLAGAAAAWVASQAGHGPLAARITFAAAGAAFAASVLVLLGVLRPRLGDAGFCRWAGTDPDEIGSQAEKARQDRDARGLVRLDAGRAAELEHARELRLLSQLAVVRYRRFGVAVYLASAGVTALVLAAVAGVIA
jgi:hypothetical protein